MNKIAYLSRSRNFIFIIVVIVGIVLHNGAKWLQYLVLPLLTVTMTMLCVTFNSGIFRFTRAFFFAAGLGIIMNYFILSNIIIFTSAFLIHDQSLWVGLVTIAAAPAALAVIPMADYLKGDENLAIGGTIGSHLGALFLMPLIGFGLLEINEVVIERLYAAILALILLPILISRLLVRKGFHKFIEPIKGKTVDICFFLLLYVIVGLNREKIIEFSSFFFSLTIVAFVSIFLLGFLIQLIGNLSHIEKSHITSVCLLGTLKNHELAGGLALFLFSREAALPALVFITVMMINASWLSYKAKNL